MKRLTTNKNVSEMSIVELAHNCCYAKDRRARYRDYDSDMDARELAIKLLDRYANIPNKFACDEDFDAFMLDALQYGMENRIGLIAIFYQNLWAMADLRERLKYYEDLEELVIQGKLQEVPYKPGEEIWCAFVGEEPECQAACFMAICEDRIIACDYRGDCRGGFHERLEEVEADCINGFDAGFIVIHKDYVFPTKEQAKEVLRKIK